MNEWIRNLSPARQAQKFHKYIGLARHIAVRLAHKHGLPLDDVVAEAESLLAVLLCDKWVCDTGRSSESHWIYQKLYWAILDYCTRKRPRYFTFSEVSTDEYPFDAASNPSILTRLRRELGDDAKEIVRIILNAPIEIADDVRASCPARARKAIQRHVRAVWGWRPHRIDKAWREVAACI